MADTAMQLHTTVEYVQLTRWRDRPLSLFDHFIGLNQECGVSQPRTCCVVDGVEHPDTFNRIMLGWLEARRG